MGLVLQQGEEKGTTIRQCTQRNKESLRHNNRPARTNMGQRKGQIEIKRGFDEKDGTIRGGRGGMRERYAGAGVVLQAICLWCCVRSGFGAVGSSKASHLHLPAC